VLVVGRVGIVGDDFSRHDAFGSAFDALRFRYAALGDVGMDCLFGAGQMKQAIDALGARQNPGAVSGARTGRTAEWTAQRVPKVWAALVMEWVKRARQLIERGWPPTLLGGGCWGLGQECQRAAGAEPVTGDANEERTGSAGQVWRAL
jgi:hypothetical protein